MNNSNRVLQYLGCLSYLIVMKLETFGNQTHEQMCCRPQLRQSQAPGALLSNILMPIQGDTLALSQDADLICHICLIHPGRGFAWLAWLGQTFVFTPKYGHSLAFGTSGVSAYDSACKDTLQPHHRVFVVKAMYMSWVFDLARWLHVLSNMMLNKDTS